MDKRKIVFSNYNKFNCIGDKCKYTCCSGWDINIDKVTFEKWKKEKQEFLKYTKKKEKEIFIDKETKDDCSFLDCKGLCKIIKEDGYDYISETCRCFPRIINDYEDITEYSLSLACPEAINFIRKNTFLIDNNRKVIESREVILNILNLEDISLNEKLLIAFQVLNIMREEDIKGIYNDKEFLYEILDNLRRVETDREEAIYELNNLFLDIITNYKDIGIFKELFKDIGDFSENEYLVDYLGVFDKSKKEIKGNEGFLLDIIKSKVISNVISENITENIISLQNIILESFLIDYSLFLKFSLKEKINKESISDYTLAFSRIITSNKEAFLEFIIESFEREIIDISYLAFIGLI
ncbi:flagellin lysine-N-methylase [Clostridium chrysemydis]|uniref:flagellin lysine-N-methylase n=1 Tax=Clostridium chrysemydis TaxID=2665504 RepID=UPI00188404B0|nr:flagellin lysine-N-methylase [Clostridium chrysemydis]